MLDFAIMIEGQNGLDWPKWQNIAHAVEELGYAGLYRSDHYTNANPPDKDSLELWVSLTWLAGNTKRIEFGPLVTPLSFRDPSLTARTAAAVDDLSGGRLTLGLGAGWQEREHYNYGWDLLDIPSRMQRLEEGIQVIGMLLRSDEPSNFSGSFYRLHEGILLPRPIRAEGPPLLLGGNGPKWTLPLVARYADEWNSLFLTPSQFSERNQRLNDLLSIAGRRIDEVRRSMMVGCIWGRNKADVLDKVNQRSQGKRSAAEYRNLGLVVGTSREIAEQLKVYESAGLQRVMLQWLDLDDLDGLEALAAALMNV